MSLNHLLSQVVENKWANPRFNSLNLDNGLNMLNSNISNVNEINGVPFSDVVNSAKSEIIWNPSQVLPKVENSYKNWSGVVSVQTAISELKGCVTINCDNTSPLHIDSSTDCQNRVILKAANTRGSGAYAVVNINDGVVLTNLYMIESSLQLKAAPTIVEPLAFSNNGVFGVRDGSNLSLGVGATKGFINLVGSAFTISGFRYGILDNSAVPAVPIITLDATSILFMLRTEASSCSNNSIVGPVGAQFIDLRDSSSPAFTNAGYLGIFTPLNLDNSNQVVYDDSKVAPPLGSSNVQGALDALKAGSVGDVKFAGAAPVINELACFAAVDGKTIQASSVGGAISVGVLSGSNGSAAAPSYTFSGDSDTGIYRIMANNVGVSCNGANVLNIGVTGLGVTGGLGATDQIFTINGSAANPSFSFTNDFNSGLYLINPSNVGLSCGSSKILDISGTGLSVTGNVVVSNNLTLSSLSVNGVLSLDGSNHVVSNILTNGQLLIGRTGLSPVTAALTGTSNQIIVTNGAGSITLSLPQNIDTSANVVFNGLTLSGVNANGVLYANGSKNLVSSNLGNGQLLIGNSGTIPSVANITGASPSQVIVTNSPGSISLSLPQDIDLSSQPEFGGLLLVGTSGCLLLNSLSTAQFNALIPTQGCTVFNTDNNSIYYFDNTSNQIVASRSWVTSNFAPLTSASFSGDVTINSGNLIVNTAGNTLKIKQGSNACAGTGVTLVSGTKTVSTTAVATGDLIFLNCTAAGGTQGFVHTTISNGVSFTITSSSVLDTSTFSWVIVKAA